MTELEAIARDGLWSLSDALTAFGAVRDQLHLAEATEGDGDWVEFRQGDTGTWLVLKHGWGVNLARLLAERTDQVILRRYRQGRGKWAWTEIRWVGRHTEIDGESGVDDASPRETLGELKERRWFKARPPGPWGFPFREWDEDDLEVGLGLEGDDDDEPQFELTIEGEAYVVRDGSEVVWLFDATELPVARAETREGDGSLGWRLAAMFGGRGLDEPGALEALTAIAGHAPTADFGGLEAIAAALQEAYEDTQREGERIVVVARFDDGRSQMVWIEPATLDDEAWIRLSSPFALAKTPRKKVEPHLEGPFGLVWVQVEDQDLWAFSLSIPLAGATWERVDLLVWAIACQADLAEAELTRGADEW